MELIFRGTAANRVKEFQMRRGEMVECHPVLARFCATISPCYVVSRIWSECVIEFVAREENMIASRAAPENIKKKFDNSFSTQNESSV